MKKNALLIAAISMSFAFASCAGGGESADANAEASTETTEEMAAEAVAWTVDPAQSNIRWTGGTAGATVYSHFGDLKVKGGSVMTSGSTITGGKFAVDMTSVDPKDDGYSEENPASKLVGHLGSPDFFNVAEYPEATFEVTSVEGNQIKGNLTIRGNTNEEVIEVSGMEMMPNGTMKATGKMVFDRQKYDVAWAHYLKDTVLSDDIKLEITLVAKKA